MIYPIVIYGAQVLREQCKEVPADYPDLKKLVEDMFSTMYEAEGVIGCTADRQGIEALCGRLLAVGRGRSALGGFPQGVHQPRDL